MLNWGCYNGLQGRDKMKLKRHGVQDLLSVIVNIESLIEFQRIFQSDKTGRSRKMLIMVKTGTSLLRMTQCLEVKVTGIIMSLQRRSHASYIMGLCHGRREVK